MKVIVKKPNQPAETKEIRNNLRSLQQEVEGSIEVAYRFRNGACMICNEEGKLLDMEPNVYFPWDVIVGPILITGTKGPEFCSLSDKQIAEILGKFFVGPISEALKV